jgi:hypothetical protein
MKITFDPDVADVASFMLSRVESRRLHQVAHALAQMADLVWRPELYDIDPDKRSFRVFDEHEICPSELQRPLDATSREVSLQTRE